MLVHLSIKNFALIDELEIDLSGELNVVTGETGAGKSILLGALGLILGDRADKQSLSNKNSKCIVEGKFDISRYDLKQLFREFDLDFEEETIIRREISPEGKSRAFVNDSPVSLQVLKELGSRLVDVHSQHETLLLNNTPYQLEVLDAFANASEALNYYKTVFSEYKSLREKLSELELAEAEAGREKDFIEFQFKELEAANLESADQDALEQELQTLNNAESIKAALASASGALSAGDINLLSSLSGIRSGLSAFAKMNPRLAQVYERLNAGYIELKDISSEIEDLGDQISHDPERIRLITDRLDLLYRLQQKHRVKLVAELLLLKESLNEKLQNFASLGDQIISAKKKLDETKQSLAKAGEKLSKLRNQAAPRMQKVLLEILGVLSMPNASLEISLEALPEPSANGMDAVRFLFSANKGGALREISRVASGGELSRLMLAIKSIVARSTALPTIIFDEIDTGVSGAVAASMGKIMEEMGGNMQVVSITHLPQIASKGKRHFMVYKHEGKDLTNTRIRELNRNERVEEIARMLGTGELTKAALSNARELLGTTS